MALVRWTDSGVPSAFAGDTRLDPHWVCSRCLEIVSDGTDALAAWDPPSEEFEVYHKACYTNSLKAVELKTISDGLAGSC